METQSILNQSAEIPQSSSTRFSIILSFLFRFFSSLFFHPFPVCAIQSFFHFLCNQMFLYLCYMVLLHIPYVYRQMFMFCHDGVGKAGGAKRIEIPDSASHTSLDLIREISF
ncbi:hypothetical protein Hanom_Chr15g01383371 [Helianthus anomalus]